jgi:hypothetical protein
LVLVQKETLIFFLFPFLWRQDGSDVNTCWV